MNNYEFLLQIIKNEFLCQNAPFISCNDTELSDIYALAKAHDLSHILLPYFKSGGLNTGNEDLAKKIKSSYNMAVFRDVKREYVKNETFDIFNNAGIKFVPLKGAVISQLYPQSWMRTSCDIDILVKEDEIEKALDVLSANGFETNRERSYHDVSLYKDGTHIELHYNICENLPRIDPVLVKVWENCSQFDKCEYRESPEFLVFHHIAHMCYHFVFGGCGIKPFIDLYLLKTKVDYSESGLKKLLEQSDLVKFYDKVCELMNVWFADAEHNSVTLKMEAYILDGGVFGNIDNNSIMMSAMRDSKTKNFFAIVFPSYETMCNTYPVLRQHKLLLVFYYIKRIIQKLTKSGDRVVGRMANLASQDAETVNTASEFLSELGLK